MRTFINILIMSDFNDKKKWSELNHFILRTIFWLWLAEVPEDLCEALFSDDSAFTWEATWTNKITVSGYSRMLVPCKKINITWKLTLPIYFGAIFLFEDSVDTVSYMEIIIGFLLSQIEEVPSEEFWLQHHCTLPHSIADTVFGNQLISSNSYIE